MFLRLQFCIFSIQVIAVQLPISHQSNWSSQRSSQQTVSEESNTLFDDFWKEKLQQDPEFSTSTGVHIYDDQLTHMGPNDFQSKHSMLVKYVSKARELLPFSDEGTNTRSNLQIFIDQNVFQIDLLTIGNQYFPVSYLDGPHVNLMQLLDYPLKTKQDFHNLISRYNAFSQQVEEIIDLMNTGITKGLTHHSKSMKNMEKTLSFLDAAADDSPFFDPFKSMPEIMESFQEIQDAARIAINEHVSPGFRKLKEYIQSTYMKHTRNNIAASSLPNGTTFYQTILKYHATEEVTPEEMHQLGKEEVARISLEMKKVIKNLGFTLTVTEFNDKIRNDPAFHFNSASEALDAYKDFIFNTIEKKLPLLFKNIPKAKMLIKEVPEHMLGAPQAFYVPGTADGETQGTFFVDTSSLKDLPRYNLVPLSLHEGIPGHHLQVSYSMEQTDVPDFRRFIQPPVNTAYLEGWALYSEYLGYELGLYEDPYMLYGYLSKEIFRACRLVVDTGIHAFGWTHQQAVDYMVANVAESSKTIENEIDRYITWPGQACAYTFGEINIKRLRNRAEKSLGEKFEIKDFHDVVLRNSGPLSFVEKEVEQWIASVH